MKLKRIFSLLLAASMILCLLPTVSFAENTDVISNGTSDYSILIPSSADSEILLAAEELNTFLGEIVGITLPVVTDSGAENISAKWISIGATSVFSASGNSVSGLKEESSVVKTYQNSILLYGGSDTGAAYAVYDLLNLWFGLEFFTPDDYTYTASSTVSFETLDQTKTPAVDYRSNGRYLTWFTGERDELRMRSSLFDDYMDSLGHSYYYLMPPSQYYSDHPDWYSNSYDSSMEDSSAGWQLCLSNAEMRAQLLSNVKARLAEGKANGKTYRYFAICQNDGAGFCTCSACKALNLKYSSSSTNYSGAQLAMLNEIADACKDEYPDTIFYMLAYTSYSDRAPTKNITASSNVGVMLAPVDCQSTDSYFGNSGTSSFTNSRVSDNIIDWNSICDHLMMWAYGAQFGDALCPTNTFDSLAANAAGYASYGFEVVFTEACSVALPFFETMKCYLECKAYYDGSIDTDSSINHFISNYYGAAGTAIRSYYDAFIGNIRTFEARGDRYKSWAASQYLNGPYCYSPVLSADNYSKTYLDTCKSYFDSAYAALSNAYATDSDSYNTYKKHVDLEYFGVLYSYLELYSSQLSATEGKQMVEQIVEIISENSITVVSTSKINTWLETYGVTPESVEFYFFESTDSSRPCTFYPFSGEANGETFTGIKVTSSSYQPHFKLSAKGVQYVQQLAAAGGYDSVRIHASADLYNNCFVIDNALYMAKTWQTYDVDVSELDENFDFWSQSEGYSYIYLWFEFYKAPAISASSFTGGISFTNFTGTVEGETFTGVKGTSSSYQPHAYFTQTAIDKIKAYAAEIDAYTLTIHAYADLYNNSLVLNNDFFVRNAWKSLTVKISDLTTSFDIWSQSEGTTVLYLWFEFNEAAVGHKSLTGTGWNFTNFSGTYEGSTFDGIYGVSSEYQPDFYFTQSAIDKIKAYAVANNLETLRIHSYPIQLDNGFVVNGAWTPLNAWTSTDILAEDLTTSTRFWSQSQGASQVYLWFEFLNLKPVSAASFTGSGCGFANGDNDTVTVSSSVYQPRFYFTAEGVQRIKDYAAENNYETLRITATYSGTNCLVLNNEMWIGNGGTNSLDVKIADLTTAFEFWSQSESATGVTFTFTFLTHQHSYTEIVTNPTCLTQGYTTYSCACGDSYVDTYISALGHDLTYKNNGETHTVSCSRCDYTLTEAHCFVNHSCVCGAAEETLNISSASLCLNQDINLLYRATVPADAENVYMTFTFMGSTFTVTSYTTEASGAYCFKFGKVSPQYMGESITAKLYATVDGTVVTDTVADYSIRSYCTNLMNNNPSDTELLALLSDLLTYGSAQQQYVGYKTDNLVTDGLTLSASNRAIPSGLSAAYTGEASATADWKSASVVISNTLALRFGFEADAIDNLSVQITLNGRTKTFSATDFVSTGDNLYYVTFDGILATEFDEIASARFYDGGNQIGREVSYSVNTYLSQYSNVSSISGFAALLQALYNYGVSAQNYAA